MVFKVDIIIIKEQEIQKIDHKFYKTSKINIEDLIIYLKKKIVKKLRQIFNLYEAQPYKHQELDLIDLNIRDKQ